MFKVLVKEGVVFKEFNSRFMIFVTALNKVSEEMKFIPTITSAAEGEHTLNSYHALDCAWDIRTRGLKLPHITADNLRIALTELDKRWEVIYGDTNHLDHIHVEFNFRK